MAVVVKPPVSTPLPLAEDIAPLIDAATLEEVFSPSVGLETHRLEIGAELAKRDVGRDLVDGDDLCDSARAVLPHEPCPFRQVELVIPAPRPGQVECRES